MRLSHLIVYSIFLLIPIITLAHQPRLTQNRETFVLDPEISKAYYGGLIGEPDNYIIDSEKPFTLYVNVLVPAIPGQRKDISAVIIKNGNTDNPLAKLAGDSFTWTTFYEPFGASTYWMGPEYQANVEAGRYEIQVFSPENNSKYSLAIGKIEAFDGKEGLHALTIIPELKKHFFNESPISFIKSPFGWGLIIAMYLLAFVVGFIYRAILKRLSKGTTRGAHHNIGKSDRLLRLAIGGALLLWAITTSWNPLILFFSGFCVFEAIFSWCGLYAMIGKNTCPL